MIIIKKLSNIDSALTITLYISLFLTVFSFLPALIYWEWPEGLVLPIDFAKIIWGALFGYIFFSEIADTLTWVGAIVVFSGACYLAWRERQLEQQNMLEIS